MLITCACCYDLTKGTKDKDFSYSFSDSLYLSYILRVNESLNNCNLQTRCPRHLSEMSRSEVSAMQAGG